MSAKFTRTIPFALSLLLASSTAFADPLPTEADDTDLPTLETPDPEPDPGPDPVPVPVPELSPTPTPASEPSPTPASLPTWNVFAGLRMAFIGSAGFDPFATNDALPQLSLGAGGTVYREDQVSLAVVGTFDIGGRSATVRGENSSLTVMSVTLGPEARYHVGTWAWLHLRPSLDVTRSLASLEESSSQATLHAQSFHVGFDVMAGGAVSLGRLGKESETRAWLVAEGGYTWSSQATLTFRPDEGDSDAPLRTSPFELGNLALRGPAFRVAAALTF